MTHPRKIIQMTYRNQIPTHISIIICTFSPEKNRRISSAVFPYFLLVVPVTAEDCAEQLSAASQAVTVYL